MPETVELILVSDAKALGILKKLKNKTIYQLKCMDDGRYNLTPFNIICFKGHLNNYLEENNIVLTYIVDDNDLELKLKYSDVIKKYGRDGYNE